ncbi:hypothetical protein [Leisingera thetidis]|uniref:hypothetical protein n=1 Tax=Leisingera thetidis TaxID=2930199 RepID=UPI003313D27D
MKSKHTARFFAFYRIQATPRRRDGFTQRDFALRKAAWLISDVISGRRTQEGICEGFQAAIRPDTPVAKKALKFDEPARISAEMKRIARFFGAGLCGITDLD